MGVGTHQKVIGMSNVGMRVLGSCVCAEPSEEMAFPVAAEQGLVPEVRKRQHNGQVVERRPRKQTRGVLRAGMLLPYSTQGKIQGTEVHDCIAQSR